MDVFTAIILHSNEHDKFTMQAAANNQSCTMMLLTTLLKDLHINTSMNYKQ